MGVNDNVTLERGSMLKLELLKERKALRPNLPVLVLTMNDESLYAEDDDRARQPNILAMSFNACATLPKAPVAPHQNTMRNTHVWKTTTAEGEKREVRAEKFGKRWRLQAKLKHDPSWTYYDEPLMEDLVALRDVLFRKYQRKHLSHDDLAAIEKMITDRGGTWVEADEAEEA